MSFLCLRVARSPLHCASPEWSRGWPQRQPDTSQIPQEWVDALNAAIAAGKVPNIPQSSNTPQTNPVYPQGVNPNGPEVCSATYKCRSPDDIWDGPDGTFATSFDDGPMQVNYDIPFPSRMSELRNFAHQFISPLPSFWTFWTRTMRRPLIS